MKKLSISLIAAALLAGCGGGNAPADSPSAHPQARQLGRLVQASDYQTVVQQLYIIYLGRPAEPAGLAYWEGVLLAAQAPYTLGDLAAAYGTNTAVQNIVDNFSNSAEFNSRGGAVVDP